MRAGGLAGALFGLGLGLVGCGGEVVEVEPPGDYTTWFHVETSGPAPGHGDTIRVIYVNDVARRYAGGSGYPLGSVLVKEIYQRSGDGRGDLTEVAIMRRLDDAPPGGELQGEWLFSEADGPNGEETSPSYCWNRCHVAAPYHGAWFDYSK